MNLAISDVLMMSKMPIFIYNSYYLGPALGDIVCRIYGFIGGLSGTCSICTLSAISLERYYVVKFPLSKRLTKIRAKIAVLVSWLYATTFSLIPLLDFGLGSYVPEGYLTSCSYDYLTDNIYAKNFILTFFIAAWVLPMTVVSYSYWHILQVVLARNFANKTRTRNSKRHIKVEIRKKQEMRVSLTVFLVILMWFLAWTPYATVSLIGICGYGKYITPLTSMVPALFCKTASCLDPFVYALMHPRYRVLIRKIFVRRSERKLSGDIRMFSTTLHERRRNDEELDILSNGEHQTNKTNSTHSRKESKMSSKM